MKKQRFGERFPVAYVLLLWVMMVGCYVVGGAITMQRQLDPIVGSMIAVSLLTSISLVILARTGWWREVGLTTPVAGRQWLPFWLPAAWLGASIAVAGFEGTDLATGLKHLLLALLVGYVEEVYFRGIMLRALQAKGLGWAIGLPTFLFGITHLLNALGGRDPISTLVQVGYALGIGLFFAAVRVRMRAVWPVALVHGLNNWIVWLRAGGMGGGAAPSAAETILAMVITLASVGYGVILLRAERAAPEAVQAV